MADTVRGIMEAMVPELEDYVARGYFSNSEVSSIIQNRQKFEYCLRRRNADKQDFLRYCEYEWKLEQLRQLRRKSKAISGKRSLADYGIVRRIHFIYDRATRKFKGDVTIWMSWLQFCRESNSKRQVSKVVTKALKLHPSAPHFWAYAAAWEFEGNSNPTAARQLLQSGLRHCPSDGSLWVEYFRMELLYANKLKARRQVLGLDDQPTDQDARATSGASPADTAILQGKLAAVVHKTAVGKLPRNADMRLDMLRATKEVAIESSGDLQQAIVSSYAADLGDDSEACCKLATVIEQGHAAQLGEGVNGACEFLHDRIQSTQDAQMQSAAVEWASDHIVALDASCCVRECPDSGATQSVWAASSSETQEEERFEVTCEDDGAADEHCDVLCEWILKWADQPVEGGCKEGVAAKKVQALLRSGQTTRAFDALKTELHQRPSSVVAWQLALRMSVASAGVKAKADGGDMCGYGSMSELVSTALKLTSGSQGCEELIPHAVACLAAMREPLDAALTHMLSSLATASVGSDGEHVAKVLEATWLAKGKDEGIALAEKVAVMPSPGAQFWRTYSKLRAQCARRDANNKVGRKERQAVSRVFEQAVLVHDKDAEIWLQYIQFLEAAGVEESVLVTHRAVAALPARAADSLTLLLRET